MKKALVAFLGLVALAIIAVALVEARRQQELERRMTGLLERIGASSARATLREIGGPAVPYLRRTLADPGRSLVVWERCLEVLAAIGPEAMSAIPTVIAARNEVVRYLEEQLEAGVDGSSGRPLAPYYRFVRAADEAIRVIQGGPGGGRVRTRPRRP